MNFIFRLILGSFLINVLVWSLFVVDVYALNLGTNITIYDGSSNEETGWHGKNEDQEVEPFCVNDQSWDLEGFFLNGSELQMVGGFDFNSSNEGFEIGDIFLDIDGDIGTSETYDEGINSVKDNFGYEYVLDLNFSDSSYVVYELNNDSYNYTVYYQSWNNHQGVNSHSNPYRYDSGGNQKAVGTFQYISNLSDSDVGFYGGTHYALVGFDLGFLNGQEFTAHLTMGCGNDNLMGQGTAPVPEPATVILMGIGLIGVAGFGRKKIKKQA